MKKLVVTGAKGLLGSHAAAHIHARNCAARFKSEPEPFALVILDREAYNDPAALQQAVNGADAVLHFAGVNRVPDDVIEAANADISDTLVSACQSVGATPHIIYANSIHAFHDTPYGRSKKHAGERLKAIGGRFTDLVLPHVFGEHARPNYNNVTATFIDSVIEGRPVEVNPDGVVTLIHAGTVAEAALDAVETGETGQTVLEGRETGVPELLGLLKQIHRDYHDNIYPDLSDDFTTALFNCYRSALYPRFYPRTLKLNTDPRGTLFEAFKGGGGGQAFASWTKPGITRGDHFHLGKVERFLVIEGEAVIRIRKVMTDEVISFEVSGKEPAFIDMPTLHTHSIENTGDTPLLTLFWSNELFDPNAPDTYADPVLG